MFFFEDEDSTVNAASSSDVDAGTGDVVIGARPFKLNILSDEKMPTTRGGKRPIADSAPKPAAKKAEKKPWLPDMWSQCSRTQRWVQMSSHIMTSSLSSTASKASRNTRAAANHTIQKRRKYTTLNVLGTSTSTLHLTRRPISKIQDAWISKQSLDGPCIRMFRSRVQTSSKHQPIVEDI